MVATASWRWARLALASLLIVTTAAIALVAPAQTARGQASSFTINASSQKCPGSTFLVPAGGTITVSAPFVLSFSDAPSPNAGVGFTPGWDDEVQVLINNVVIGTRLLGYTGGEFGSYFMPATTFTIPAGLLDGYIVEVRARRWGWRTTPFFFFGVVDTRSGFANIGGFIVNTCTPTTSLKPQCVKASGGALSISGQANRSSLEIVMDDAVTVASGIPADASGFFNGTVNIPAVARGTHVLRVGSGPPGDFSEYGAPASFVVPCSSPPPTNPPTTPPTAPPTTPAPPPTTVPPAPAALTINPPNADAGALGVGQASAPVVLTVANVGQSPTTMAAAAAIGGANAPDAAVSADTCANFALAAGATCTVTVGMTPRDSGPRSVTVTYASTDASVAPVTATITVTGAFGATITIEPSVVQARASVDVTGKGFPASTPLQLVWLGFGGNIAVTTDAAGSFVLALMVPAHFEGGRLTLKVVDQLPRFAGPSDDLLVQRPTARPAGPSDAVAARRPFWRG